MSHLQTQEQLAFQRFSSICPSDIKFVHLTEADKNYMLNSLNFYRMLIALGEIDTYITGQQEFFPTASRMMKMVSKMKSQGFT